MSISESMEIINYNEKSEDSKKNKLNEGMLWHIRLGHASLGYLKQIQKSDEKLKGIKFQKKDKDGLRSVYHGKDGKITFFRE